MNFSDLREGDEVARESGAWQFRNYEIGRVDRVEGRLLVVRWPVGSLACYWRHDGAFVSSPRHWILRVTDEIREAVERREIARWLRGFVADTCREEPSLELLRALRAVARDPGLPQDVAELPCEYSPDGEVRPGEGEVACRPECDACLLRRRALAALERDGGAS